MLCAHTLHGCGHFHGEIPPRSPSPVALEGGTLPRWGREWVSALCRGRRPRRPRSNTKDKQKHPANPQRFLVGRADPGAPHSNIPVFNKPPANSQLPFPSPGGGRWHPPIPREADDGRGRISPLADGKIVRILPRLRSFPQRGPVTFSLSCRPCGRHPPPLGEGMGECAWMTVTSGGFATFFVGAGVPTAPAGAATILPTYGESAHAR